MHTIGKGRDYYIDDYMLLNLLDQLNPWDLDVYTSWYMYAGLQEMELLFQKYASITEKGFLSSNWDEELHKLKFSFKEKS